MSGSWLVRWVPETQIYSCREPAAPLPNTIISIIIVNVIIIAEKQNGQQQMEQVLCAIYVRQASHWVSVVNDWLTTTNTPPQPTSPSIATTVTTFKTKCHLIFECCWICCHGISQEMLFVAGWLAGQLVSDDGLASLFCHCACGLLEKNEIS